MKRTGLFITWASGSKNSNAIQEFVTPDEWKKLNKAASWGIGNIKQAEKALKSKRHGYTSDRKRAAAELTIEIFRRICE